MRSNLINYIKNDYKSQEEIHYEIFFFATIVVDVVHMWYRTNAILLMKDLSDFDFFCVIYPDSDWKNI